MRRESLMKSFLPLGRVMAALGPHAPRWRPPLRRLNAQLAHPHMPVSFDGSFGRTQQVGNPLVQFARDHQREYFGSRAVSVEISDLKGIKLVLAPLRRHIAGKRALDRFHQWFPRHRFGQEIFRTGLDRVYAHGDIPMACHENNGPVAGQPCKLFLKLKATQVWHPYVEDDATRSGISNRAQEASRGVIFRDLITAQFQQSRDRLPKRRVVVDDMNYGRASRARRNARILTSASSCCSFLHSRRCEADHSLWLGRTFASASAPTVVSGHLGLFRLLQWDWQSHAHYCSRRRRSKHASRSPPPLVGARFPRPEVYIGRIVFGPDRRMRGEVSSR